MSSVCHQNIQIWPLTFYYRHIAFANLKIFPEKNPNFSPTINIMFRMLGKNKHPRKNNVKLRPHLMNAKWVNNFHWTEYDSIERTTRISLAWCPRWKDFFLCRPYPKISFAITTLQNLLLHLCGMHSVMIWEIFRGWMLSK